MTTVPAIVYSHPIQELPQIPDNVASYSLNHSNALESASLVNRSPEIVPPYASAKSSQNPTPENGKLKHKNKDKEPKSGDKNSMDDYLFQAYIGSVSIIGLLILFRIMNKK